MAKSTTPSFMTTIPLVVTSGAGSELLSRFQVGRQLYNALLNEAMAWMRLVQQSSQYQFAPTLAPGKARTEAFATARKQYRYSEYDLQAYAKRVAKASKPKKGRRYWNQSQRYGALATKKRELERRKSEYSKSQNRRLVNDILRQGNQIKTEKVSVKGWQKIWGKAMSAKSPGFFQSELKRKAEKAGSSFYQFSTRNTALSQTHLTGERIKKTLSQRVHYDKSGVVMHRDLMSAFLSRHVYDDRLSLQDAQVEYPGMETTLLRAWQQYQLSANRVSASESQCSHSPVELIRSDSEKSSQIASFRMGDKLDIRF